MLQHVHADDDVKRTVRERQAFARSDGVVYGVAARGGVLSGDVTTIKSAAGDRTDSDTLVSSPPLVFGAFRPTSPDTKKAVGDINDKAAPKK